MPIVLTSPGAFSTTGEGNALRAALASLAKQGHPVGVISNHTKPAWFDADVGGSGVSFLEVQGRQNGEFLEAAAAHFKVKPHEILVLAGVMDDVQMGKNGGAILLGAEWSTDLKVRSLGISVGGADELMETVRLSHGWAGSWWFTGTGATYAVKALCDLSTFHKDLTQVEFADRVTNTVKAGGPRLKALLTVCARSLLGDGMATEKDLAFGVYPSSASSNDDTEVLSDFTQRLRTTVSRVRYAERGAPLFIRHKPSAKRSAGGGGDRTNPSNQIETVHVNPEYTRKLVGRHVVVIDDCTTYGVSFGVASALLRRAGASKVTGVALGKFGNQLREYDITIDANPFAPIPRGRYKVANSKMLTGTTNATSQQTLVSLLA